VSPIQKIGNENNFTIITIMARDQKPKKMTAQLKVTSQCRRGKAHLIIIIEHEHRHWISHNQYWILLLFLFFSFHCRNYDFVTTAFLHPNTRAYSALYRKRTKLDRFYQVTSASSPEVTTSPQYTVPRQKYKNSNGSSNNYQRHTKLKIKRMFQKAQDLTRTGQWWDASRILEDILEIDPRDAHSHLALARLESRREFASTATSKCTSSATDQPNPSISVTNNNGRRHYSSNNTLLWATTITNHSTIPTTTAQTYDNDKHHYSPLLIIGNNTTAQIMDIPPLPSPTSSPARAAFYRGTKLCPKSIHLWQAWALHEQSMGNLQDARTLFQICLTMDSRNAHVCHAFGLMERRLGNHDQAQELWTVALEVHSTAALVCSLGELYIVRGQLEQARTLYENHLFRVSTERERTELYLAMAWLEERYLANRDRALECIQTALSASPNNSRAQVALARLQGRREADLQQQNQAIHTHAPQHNNTSHSYTNNNSRVNNMRLSKKTTSVDPNNISLLQHQDSNALTRLHFAEACEKESTKCDRTASTTTTTSKSDGRLFNAWANLEAKSGRLKNARRILLQGIKRFPHDHSVSNYGRAMWFT
jgi:tetratricopeptide (TPR) repeat protein